MTKIMLVEDDNNLREIYGARLSAEGYEIVFAQDGEEALALAVKEKPELIVSDVMMPKISGFDMLDILRNAPETKNTKVIMMTALSQAEDQERAERLGADKYLVKSQVTLEDVVKTIKEVLGEADTPDSLPSGQTSNTDGQPDTGDTPQPGLATQPTDENPTTPEPAPSAPVSQSNIDVAPAPAPEVVGENTDTSQPAPTPTQEPTASPEQPEVTDSTPSEPVQAQPSPDNSPSMEPSAPTQSNTSDDQSTNDNSSPSDNNNSVVSTATSTPIAVTLPDDPSQPQSSGITQASSTPAPQTQDEPSSSQPDPVTTSPGPEAQEPQIGPDLNEALHNAEDEIKKEISTMESPVTTASSAPAVANGGEVSQIVEPSEPLQPDPVKTDPQQDTVATTAEPPQPQSAQTDNNPPQTPTEQPVASQPQPPTEPSAPEGTKGITEDQNGKKTINPINDLSSKPDLNELLAKEQAQSGIENPPVSSVITPGGEVSANTTEPSSQSDTNTEPTPDSVPTKESPITPAPAPDPKDDIAL